MGRELFTSLAIGATSFDVTTSVGVCVPVYNGVRTLERCVDSVTNSRGFDDPSHTSVILCDDCSTDGTGALLDRLGRRPGVSVHLNPQNLGLTGNWQRALSLSSEEVVTLLHMDDWHAEGCLEAVRARFDADPSLVLLGVGQEHRLEDGSAVDKNPDWKGGSWRGADYFRQLMRFENCPAPSMTFFRRSALSALPTLFDPAFRWCPELDLYLRLCAAHPTGTFAHDERRLVLRGASKNQFSFRYPSLSIIDTCSILSRHLNALSPEERPASRAAARTAITGDLLALAGLVDPGQTARLLRNETFRRWLSDPRNATGIVQNALPRVWRAARRRLVG